MLSAFIEFFLSKKAGEFSQADDDHSKVCEWRPLNNLLLFSQRISLKQPCSLSGHVSTKHTDSSFIATLEEAEKMIRSGCTVYEEGIIKALYSSIICTTSDAILQHFSSILSISHRCHEVSVFFISSIFFSEHRLLASLCNLWPDIFFGGLKMALFMIEGEAKMDDSSESAHYSSILNKNDSTAAAAAGFMMFLNQIPFHVLFPTVVNAEFGPSFLETSSKLRDLLLYKLSNCTTDYLISSLRILLFWICQLRSLYRKKPSVEVEELSETCSILIARVLENLLVSDANSDCAKKGTSSLSISEIQEVAETVFYHPAVLDSLTCPLESSVELQYRLVMDNFENFLSSGLEAHRMDQHVLSILTSVSKYLLSTCNFLYSESKIEYSDSKRLVAAFSNLVQRLLLKLKEKFEFCIEIKDWVPLLSLIHI